jgi:hypothetical protein
MITVDVGEVLSNLKRLDTKTLAAAKNARAAVGDELLRLSQKEVPHDEGTLANSGVSQEDGRDHVVGYNTPYAARLHEHPEYNFQKGRKGKYLEDPIKRNQGAFKEIFKEEFEAQLK